MSLLCWKIQQQNVSKMWEVKEVDLVYGTNGIILWNDVALNPYKVQSVTSWMVQYLNEDPVFHLTLISAVKLTFCFTTTYRKKIVEFGKNRTVMHSKKHSCILRTLQCASWDFISSRMLKNSCHHKKKFANESTLLTQDQFGANVTFKWNYPAQYCHLTPCDDMWRRRCTLLM